MRVDLSSILIVLSIFAIIGGFLAWILSLFLTDKKDKLKSSFEIDRLKEQVTELRQEVDRLHNQQRY